MNSNVSLSLPLFLFFPEFQTFFGYLNDGKFNEAIEFINNNTSNERNIFINLLYDTISQQIENSVNNGNYEDCHEKISLLQKINNKPNGFEAAILNKDGCIYFNEKNYNKAYSLFMDALKKSNEVNEIYGNNLFNSFMQNLQTLKDNKNFQEIYDKSIEIQNAPNTNFSRINKIALVFSEFKSSIYLNLSNSESLANKLIEEIKGENFEYKNNIISEISLFFYGKQKNVNRAYEVINLIEPNKDFLYLQLKIILSNIKIKELLNNQKNEEAEKIYESIKNLDLNINELNVEEELKNIYKDLEKIISDTGNLFIEKKIKYYN